MGTFFRHIGTVLSHTAGVTVATGLGFTLLYEHQVAPLKKVETQIKSSPYLVQNRHITQQINMHHLLAYDRPSLETQLLEEYTVTSDHLRCNVADWFNVETEDNRDHQQAVRIRAEIVRNFFSRLYFYINYKVDVKTLYDVLPESFESR